MHKEGHPLVPKSPDTGLFVIALKHRRQWSCLIPLIILGGVLVIAIALPNDSLATDANGLISVNTILVIESHPDYPAPLLFCIHIHHPVVCTPSIFDQGQQVGTAVPTVYPDDHIRAQRSTQPTKVWTDRIVSEKYLAQTRWGTSTHHSPKPQLILRSEMEHKAGESSKPKLERRPSPLQSSAAFLHHLHTDPKSHHITLSAGLTRQPSAPPTARSPQPVGKTLEAPEGSG